MKTEKRVGRFSCGQETLEENVTHTRAGRFCDGQAADAELGEMIVGRFSTGQEHLTGSAVDIRIGSFADRDEPRPPITLRRTAGERERVEAETVTS